MFCSLCGDHARHAKSPEADLRRKGCPRFPGGVIHRGCCAQEVCSERDTRDHVRCGWDKGGRERLAFMRLKGQESVAPQAHADEGWAPARGGDPASAGTS